MSNPKAVTSSVTPGHATVDNKSPHQNQNSFHNTPPPYNPQSPPTTPHTSPATAHGGKTPVNSPGSKPVAVTAGGPNLAKTAGGQPPSSAPGSKPPTTAHSGNSASAAGGKPPVNNVAGNAQSHPAGGGNPHPNVSTGKPHPDTPNVKPYMNAPGSKLPAKVGSLPNIVVQQGQSSKAYEHATQTTPGAALASPSPAAAEASFNIGGSFKMGLVVPLFGSASATTTATDASPTTLHTSAHGTPTAGAGGNGGNHPTDAAPEARMGRSHEKVTAITNHIFLSAAPSVYLTPGSLAFLGAAATLPWIL